MKKAPLLALVMPFHHQAKRKLWKRSE